MSATISLKKQEQKKVSNKANRLKKKLQAGKIVIKEKLKARKQRVQELRGLVYIGHLPHGFYEKEIKEYFSQFGKVTNVKVCRSRNNGNSKGFGYVEFAYADVAKIAAETMHNYIMFKKRVIAHYVPHEKRPKSIFLGRQSMPEKCTKSKRQERNNLCRNRKINDETYLNKSKKVLTRLQKKLERINKLGINYEIKPFDVPQVLQDNK